MRMEFGVALVLLSTAAVASYPPKWNTSGVVYKYRSDLRDMTVREWSDATLCEVAENIFHDEEVTKAVSRCQIASLSRRLRFNQTPSPHIALARVVFTAYDYKLEAYGIPQLFCSSIDAESAVERMDEPSRSVLSARRIVRGISPYKGSPCRFAHSERAVGIFLDEKLQEILSKRSNNEQCLIQIKTSLPPCSDCVKFWGGSCRVTEENVFCEDSSAKMVDWLKEISKVAAVEQIGVEISCSAEIEGEKCELASPFFRKL